MSFKEHYFTEEDKDTNMQRTFLDNFKETYLPNKQMNASQENVQLANSEWLPFSIEIHDADSTEKGVRQEQKVLDTNSFKFVARFGVHNLFAGDESNYNPEQFFDRELLMSMKNDIFRLLNDGNMLVLNENVVAPNPDEAEDIQKKAAEGTYGTVFDIFYDVQERNYQQMKRELGYDNDYFIVVHAVARKS